MKTFSQSEVQRIKFVINTHGMTEAIRFATTTEKVYRTSVLRSRKRGFDKPNHLSFSPFRERAILSYLQFRDFLKNPGEYQ